MIRRPPRSTLSSSSAASDVYKRQHYKELVCEHSGGPVVVDTMVNSKDEKLQEEARILLLNLGRGNPRFQVHVAETVLTLLGCGNAVAQRMGAQSTRQYMQTLPPGFDSVVSCMPMLKSGDLQVQYEASELIKALSKYAYLHEAIIELSLIHISEPTRLLSISYAVFCLKKKKKTSIFK
eukprot:TRINITY_DN26652_c0_g1_i1.p1 TRINITY_DN26652_c0_g1~~TRINITY_DN26652_c0_g1_i1.p1  ORF type:complete len:179 (+),score=71.13 TRINITY_DN26652_c0_g1_i1:95-631(+)